MLLTTFPRQKDFDSAVETLCSFGLSYEVIYPTPGCRLVGVPAVVVEEKAVAQLASSAVDLAARLKAGSAPLSFMQGV